MSSMPRGASCRPPRIWSPSRRRARRRSQGVGNGDPTCHEPDKGSMRSAFQGQVHGACRRERPNREGDADRERAGAEIGDALIDNEQDVIRISLEQAKRKKRVNDREISHPLRFLLATLCGLLVGKPIASRRAQACPPAHAPLRDALGERGFSQRTRCPNIPRPQMTRARWQNLNGTWQFRSRRQARTKRRRVGKTLGEKILVPYPVEATLSGVGRREPSVWYRRTFTVPDDWRSRTTSTFCCISTPSTINRRST